MSEIPSLSRSPGWFLAARAALVGLALAGTPLLASCGGEAPAAKHPERPLDERRAAEIIASAFRDKGLSPVPGPEVEMAGGRMLEIDVTATGFKFGVAYMNVNDRRATGDAVPPRDDSMGDALQLVRGPDGESRYLILHDTHYTYDDNVGTDHESPTLVAERKLRRDVTDFLVRAAAEKWP